MTDALRTQLDVRTQPLDLRELTLDLACWRGLDLRDADLRRVRLRAADLRAADLRGARLAHADLSGIDLSAADLRGADLTGADLTGACLADANLSDADLTDANLTGANLSEAELRGANLPEPLRPAALAPGASRPNARAPDSGQTSPGPTPERQVDPAPWDTDDAPAAALATFEHARALHQTGRLAAAERAYLRALRWQPDAAVTPYALACLAADRDDAESCAAWLAEALVHAPASPLLQAEAARLGSTQPDGADTAIAAMRKRELAASRTAPAAAAHRHDWRALLDAWSRQGAAGGARAANGLADWARWRMEAAEAALPGWLARCWPEAGLPLAVRWQALGVHALTAEVTLATGRCWLQLAEGGCRSAASLGWTQDVVARLAACGLRVPTALADRSGPASRDLDPAHGAVCAVGADWLAVHCDLDGTPLPRTAEAATAAGRWLAALHLETIQWDDVADRPDTAPLPACAPRGRLGVCSGARTLLEDAPEQRWQRAVAGWGGQGPLPPAQWADALRLASRRLQADLRACPQGICHGDFGPHNLVRDARGALGVLDWDLADRQPLVWDLARALDLWAVRWPTQGADPPELDLPVLRALLRAYDAARPLSAQEWRVLPGLVALSRLDLDVSLISLLAPLQPELTASLLAPLAARFAAAAADNLPLAGSPASLLGTRATLP